MAETAAARKPAARKASPTPKRAQSSTKNPERPPRPEFVVIEDNLHYSPDGEREIVLTIDPEWSLVEAALVGSGAEVAQSEMFRNVLNLVYGDDTAAELIRGLKTSQFFTLVYRWMEEFEKNMNVESPGES